MQVNAHIILCLRAEEKIEMIKGKDGKMEIQKKQSLVGKDGWIPICDKNLPFEATCSFLLLAANPGIPHPIKLQEQHRALFPLDKPIDEESGKRLAAWAAGGASVPAGASVGQSPGEKSADPAADKVLKQIKAAPTMDALNEAADIARSLTDEGAKKKAREAYATRRKELTEGAHA